MHTLILGYTSYFNTNASSALAHERAVRATFQQYGTGTSDIGMLYGNPILLDQSDVTHTWDGNSDGAETYYPKAVYALVKYLSQNPNEYDLIVFSYEVDVYYINVLSYIPNVLGIGLVMPMTNAATVNTTCQGEQFITFVGRGTTANVAGTGTRIDCYDNQGSTSQAVPMVAGKMSQLISAGLTQEQARIALIKACDNYPTWDATDGYGRVPSTIPVPEDYTFNEKGVTEYEANYQFIFGYTGNEDTTYFQETVEQSEVETEVEETQENAPEETVQEEREAGNEVIDVPLSTPTAPSTSRSGTTVAVTPNETATTLKLYRKSKLENDWELIGTTTESSITDTTADETKNYMYAVKIANTVTESDYSEPAYVAGADFGGIAGGYI